MQVDVKYVPKRMHESQNCKKKEEKYYQYTAIDEFTRLRYTWYTNEHSTYMSSRICKKADKIFSESNMK